jgi:hypothetical protein
MPAIPTVEGTYHAGAALDLYAWRPPARPNGPWSQHGQYEDPKLRMTQHTDRYNKSISERFALPSTPPDVSITLEKRISLSMRRVPHVWSARIHNGSPNAGTTTDLTTYPPLLIAKIFDPVFFDDDEAEWSDPFALRDLGVSYEAETYERLISLQGTKVPRFYGHFVTPLLSQDGRMVNVILLEQVPGIDLRTLVPDEVTEKLCLKHKDAIIDAALCLFFDVLARGVFQRDMQPRNIILRPQQGLVSGTQYCTTSECPLYVKVACSDLDMVMVDFELVEFKEPEESLSEQSAQRTHIESIKSKYLERWFKNAML